MLKPVRILTQMARSKALRYVAAALGCLAICGIAVVWVAFLGVYRFWPSALFPLSSVSKRPVPDVSCAASLRWQTLRAAADEPARVEGCAATTSGPWLLDENHIFPAGVGPLHVLMYTLVRTSARPNWGIDNTKRPLDLTGRTLVVRHRATGIAATRPVYFWVQVEQGPFGRRSNFYFRQALRQPFEDQWATSRLDLAEVQKFQCLGTRLRKYKLYSCDVPIQAALQDVNIDFGFIRFAPDGHGGSGQDTFTIGAITFE